MRYKCVLMDIDDTLFDFMPGNRKAIALLMEELGLSSPTIFDEYQAINHACWQALERGEMDTGTLHVERFRRFLSEKQLDDDPERVADRFAQLLGQQVIPLPYAEETVKALSERLPVILLTNGITIIQKRRMAASPIRHWISGMVISQEVGCSKPDPNIFEIALNGVDPRDALMIGDGTGSDVLGANRAGVDVCWYNPKGKALPDGLHVEYEIQDLRQCLAIATQQ